jgi:hypothetical protein
LSFIIIPLPNESGEHYVPVSERTAALLSEAHQVLPSFIYLLLFPPSNETNQCAGKVKTEQHVGFSLLS